MTRLLFGITLLLATSAQGQAFCSKNRPSPPPEFPQPVRMEAPVNVAAGCPLWRWVARLEDGSRGCPLISVGSKSWEVRPLFTAATPDRVPPVLRRFCLYEYWGGSKVPKRLIGAIERRSRRPDFDAEPDCAAVAATASGAAMAEDKDLSPLASHFLAQAGRFQEQFSEARAAGVAGAARTRLTFIDTQPTGTNKPRGLSGHGYALTWMARRLLCDGASDPGDESCAVRIRSRLGLPIERYDRNNPRRVTFNTDRGGYFGTIPNLSVALWDELVEWDSEEDENLVLNLSLAWDGQRFGGLEEEVEDMPIAAQTLFQILRVAACRGALVVAAAGNRTGGPDGYQGPLLPAAWESRHAPAGQDCPAILGSAMRPSAVGSGNPGEASEGGPLLYAVGGVRADGSPLSNARMGGTPRRVAYADHAVVTGKEDSESTAILTGTSVAAAVVSSAAAAVWAYRSDLDRTEVMQQIDASGEALPRSAELFYRAAPLEEGDSPGVRRISVCHALRHTCTEGGGHCGAPACTPEPPERPRVDNPVHPNDQEVDASLITEDFGLAPECDAERILHLPGRRPQDPCPGRQFHGIPARPWTGPQPYDDPCTTCTIDPPPGLLIATETGGTAPYTLLIEVDPDWVGPELRDGVLKLGNTLLHLDMQPLRSGDGALVTNIDPKYFQGALPHAVLQFETDDGSVESPLFILGHGLGQGAVAGGGR